MPRRQRVTAPGVIHHVTIRGNDRTVVFRDDGDRMAFLRRLRVTAARFGLELHAYCLMDTHVHLIVQAGSDNLGASMRYLLGGYAHSFNRRHRRTGHLFEGPFHSRPITDDSYLITAVAYVVVNPVRANLCDHPRDYPWSSFATTMGDVDEPVVTVSAFVLELLSIDMQAARARFAARLDEQIREMRRTAGSG